MYRLAWLLTIINIVMCSAKHVDIENNELEQLSEEIETYPSIFGRFGNGEKLWVMDIRDEIDNLTLRAPTWEEEMDFKEHFEPLIRKYQSLKLKTSDVTKTPNVTTETQQATKEDVFKFLNKFALFSKTAPDSYLSDSHQDDDPSIAINFKGQYTALIVKMGESEWHYFYSKPPLPAWFYENPIQNTIRVPDNIKEKFYTGLYNLLFKAMNYLV